MAKKGKMLQVTKEEIKLLIQMQDMKTPLFNIINHYVCSELLFVKKSDIEEYEKKKEQPTPQDAS